MKDWILPSLATIVFWGIWGFLPKLASSYLNPKSIFIYQFLGHLVVISCVLVSIRFQPEFNIKGLVFAICAGLAAATGTVFFLHAINKGKASVVVTITALYPLVSIALSLLFLKENLTSYQSLGILFSILALLCFSR